VNGTDAWCFNATLRDAATLLTVGDGQSCFLLPATEEAGGSFVFQRRRFICMFIRLRVFLHDITCSTLSSSFHLVLFIHFARLLFFTMFIICIIFFSHVTLFILLRFALLCF
jgi:hypothetical protein